MALWQRPDLTDSSRVGQDVEPSLVVDLSLWGSGLTGQIPPELGDLSRLRVMWFGINGPVRVDPP